MFSPESGAEIRARSSKPSIELATLVELVAQAIPTSNNTGKPDDSDPTNRQVLLFDAQKKRLKLCTSAVLRRLFSQQDFRQAFGTTKGSGFIQNLQMPGYGFRAHIGGYLTEGNVAKLTAAVDRLISTLDHSINAALPEGTTLSSLLLDNPEQQLDQLARAAGKTFNQQANTASLVPLRFKAEATTTDRDKPVAKAICAIEQIEADDYFERMCSAVSEYLQQRDFDEDDVEAAVGSLEAEKDRADSQITRFLNFLDDEALSRVRLSVTLQIMKAIADNARKLNQARYKLLAEHVTRVTNLLETVKADDYTIDLTAHYGAIAEFDLLEYMSKATFYSCLPVWAAWKTQIFEVRDPVGTTYAVTREVSYRFRVNGKNPELQKPAFEARLDNIEDELLNNEEALREQSWRVCRRLAELIFLEIVVPRHDNELLTQEALSNNMQQLLATLKSRGKEAVRDILQDLRERAASMKSIATALTDILRSKGQTVISQAQERACEQFICVKRGIMQWTRLEGAEPGVRDLLVGPQQSSREQVEWFKHIEICDRPETPGLLFSVKVKTEMTAHNLTIDGKPNQIQAQRLLPQQLLQICWVPYYSEKQDARLIYKVSPTALMAKGWVLPASIHVEYDTRTLTRKQNQKQAEENKQYHTAAVAAFTVLVYCCLWRIIQRLKQSGDKQSEFTTLMLRLQETRKPDDEGSGDSYVYAAAQTIEAMLAQDINIRMQGLALENLIKQDKSTPWVKKGTFDAILSAFPIVISTPSPPAVPKIGLISYATRPCDETPSLSDDEKGYLFLTQSYIATDVQQPFPGYELKTERMQADVVDSPERLQKQRLVREEIGHLQAQGCQHIILLSHAYGSRRINRTAEYNSPLTPKEFLEEVFGTFPDLTIYTMLRDVFPATRLHNRAPDEAAFEILKAGDHTSFLQSVETVRVRDVIPVYTFATLYAIEKEQRPQSGFCSYFLVSDQRLSNLNWTERPRQHLVDPEENSTIRPCLITVLKGLHFIEAERGVNKKGQLTPVLDPFSWISPTTIEAAGDVGVMHTRRKGQVLLSYPALLSRIATVLHRRK